MTENGVGASVRRKEDRRFLRGKGRYTDDIDAAGQAHAVFARSPHARARIRGIDAAAARAAPGVLAVLTGEELEADGIGPLVCGVTVTGDDGEPHRAPPHPALARGNVNYVGDPVAVVIAESPAQARDGAERVAVDYEPLPAVVDTATAADEGRPRIHEAAPDNVCFDWSFGDREAVDAAFASAHRVSRLELVNNRMVTNPMEPRAALGEYDGGTGEITLHLTTQNPHVHRLVLSAFNQLAPEHKLRVVGPDVGGGFGAKIFVYAEELVVGWACRRLGRPVKWTAERSEAFLADAHGRDHVSEAEMAMDGEGRFLAMRVRTRANLGAYLSTFATMVPSYLYVFLLAGQYATPLIHSQVKAVFTNTAPVDASRGAGRPEATFLLERLVDVCALDMGLDPAEIRRRNFIPPDAFPYQTPVVQRYDSGDYPAALDKALAMADYEGFAARAEAARARGRRRGIGLSSYVEACGIAPSAAAGQLGAGVGLWESAQVRFNPTGDVQVFTGTHSHGQGHETTFAQLVTERLGVPIDKVEVIHGDTARIQFGMGTYGSRSLAVGGVAIARACDKLIEKGRKIAAHALEAEEGDIEFAGGSFTVAGTDRAMTIAEAAFNAYVPHSYPEGLEPGFDENAFFDPVNFSFPAGTHVCEVEVDPETGEVEIVKYCAVDDFGKLINPMIVEGQVHGGIVHGVGQALLEGCRYDRDGQLVTASYMDYAMPRADDVPGFELDYAPTDPPDNPLGVKGCGEAGAIGAPPAVINAVANALGVRHVPMPATPETVWRAARGAAGRDGHA